MDNMKNADNYKDIIKKIKRKKRIIKLFVFISVFTTLIFLSPDSKIMINDTVIHTSGAETYTGMIISLVVIFIGVAFANSFVLLPLQTAMLTECDPEKYMVLNEALGNKKQLDAVYAVGYLFSGEFGAALEYASKVIASKNAVQSACGWFHKARCEFLMKNPAALEYSLDMYKAATAKIKNKKQKAEFAKMQKVIELMVAIADNDIEKIKNCNAETVVWNESIGAHGFVNYIKGLAAYHTGETADCTYYMTYVKKNCGKTVFAFLADEILNSLQHGEA